jgi:hypothetical protein
MMLAAGLSVALGAAGMGSATASAQSIPDCTWIDCVPREERVPVRIKWPPPVCLSCPADFRDLAELIRTQREGLTAIAFPASLSKADVVLPDQLAAPLQP